MLSGVPDSSSRLLNRLQELTTMRSHPKPARYDELLHDLRSKYHVGCVIPYFTEYVHDRNGNLEYVNSRFSRSFVQGTVALLQVQLGQAAVTITATDATSNSTTANSASFAINQSAGSNTYGIQWGTGSTAEATTDAALVTLIANGTGASQISYGSCANGNFNPGGSSTTITVTRSGTSTAGVTVGERGLVYDNSSAKFILGIRDVASVVIGALATITTVYTLDFAL